MSTEVPPRDRATPGASERETLLAALRRMDARTDEEWAASLSPRKKAELEFFDELVSPPGGPSMPRDTWEAVHGKAKYYETTGRSREFVTRWITSNAPGRVFLDYACGDGRHALLAARSGATLAVGIDISRLSIESSRRAAQQQGLVDRAFFVRGDCEDTGLPEESIDLAVCSGMLHHLDLSYALPELRRILRPGGRVLAYEALDYNPLIKLYRRLTPSLRTEWERSHILSLEDVAFARRFFDVRDIRYWHLLSILATPFRATPLFRPLLSAANALDAVALRVFPLRLMGWIFTFELVKRRG